MLQTIDYGMDGEFCTALYTAIHKEAYEIIKFLIYNECPLDMEYCNPIEIAIKHNDITFIKYLRSKGYKCNLSLVVPIILDKNSDNDKLLEYFLKDCMDDISASYPLAYASAIYDIDLFKQFQSYGFNNITIFTLICAIDLDHYELITDNDLHQYPPNNKQQLKMINYILSFNQFTKEDTITYVLGIDDSLSHQYKYNKNMLIKIINKLKFIIPTIPIIPIIPDNQLCNCSLL
jgi:hypothetical protein